MSAHKFTQEEITAEIVKLSGWEFDGDFLIKEWEFEDFKESFEFVKKVSAIAEENDHHPDIGFGWGYVEVALTTHELEGVSENDFMLAKLIDEIS